MRNSSEIARYEQIALDLAGKIAKREYAEGTRLYGRSTLAGRYNVSPETIRRSIALLQSMGIVESQSGRGIIIRSRDAAEAFLREFEGRKLIEDLKRRISLLLVERRKIDQLLEDELNQLINLTFKTTSRLQQIEEIQVIEDSELVGKSLESIGFRKLTGATVLALERAGEEMFSPDSGIPIEPGDLLVFVGTSEAKEKVRMLANGTTVESLNKKQDKYNGASK